MIESRTRKYMYCCLFCESPLGSSFYTCSNQHLCCVECRLIGGYCPKCHVLQIFCCALKVYEASAKTALFKRIGAGPIVLLPEPDRLIKKDLLVKCPSCESTENFQARLLNCMDCGKYLSSSRLLDHYLHDHPTIHVCPIPSKGSCAFKFNPDDVEMGKIKRIQTLKLIPKGWLYPGSEEEDNSGGTKILFVLATRVWFFNNLTATLLWVSSSYNACLLTYTIEVRGEKNNIATALFTGTPIRPKIMKEVLKGRMCCEELGQYLAVKDTLIAALNIEGGGPIVNVLIH